MANVLNTKNKNYTPKNVTANLYEPNIPAYKKEVLKEIEWIKQNPGVKDPNGYKNLGITGEGVPEGRFTTDEAEVDAAFADQKLVFAANQNGQKGHIISGVERPQQEGASGADEAWMTDKDYHYLTGLKSQWWALEEEKAAATPERLTEIEREQNALHAQAETIRYGYGYVGGEDGSMYIRASHLEPGGLDSIGAYNGYDPLTGRQGGSGSSTGRGTTGRGSSAQVSVPDLPDYAAIQVPTAPDVEIDDYSRYIEELQNAQLDAALAEYEEAYRKNVSALERAGVGVDEAYWAARNRTVGAADLADRNFAELANASGLGSGTGGQAALARGVALQNDLNDLNVQEAQTLADLQQRKADNDAWYNGAIAAAKAEGNAQKAQLLYQEKIRVESATMEAIQQKFTNEITVYRAKMDAAQQQFDNEVAKMSLEYQQLRDSVADAQWQAQFDYAYERWAQEVAAQQAKMELQRQQWEQEVAAQQEKLALQYKELEAEQQQDQDNRTQRQSEALADYGKAYLQAGIMPSSDMLAAMGITAADAQRYIDAITGVAGKVGAVGSGNRVVTRKENTQQ